LEINENKISKEAHIVKNKTIILYVLITVHMQEEVNKIGKI